MNNFQITQVEPLVERCWNALGSWKAWIIAIDGRDGVGKSLLGRYLAYRYNMPCFSTDEFLLPRHGLIPRAALGHIINRRLRQSRPLIVEGIFVVDTLKRIQLCHDYLIRVKQAGCDGFDDWQDAFADYEGRVQPDEIVQRPADCVP